MPRFFTVGSHMSILFICLTHSFTCLHVSVRRNVAAVKGIMAMFHTLFFPIAKSNLLTGHSSFNTYRVGAKVDLQL